MPGENRGVIVIQSTPWRRNIVLVVIASVVLGFLLSRLFAELLFTPLAHILAALGGAIACFAILTGALTLAYPTVAFDPERRVARLGGRTVPLDTLETVERRVSANARSASLVYRLRSTRGPSARVLVAGRPFAGLDDAGRAALADLLRIAPVRVEDEHAAERAAIAANIVADNARVPISAEIALRELAGFDAPAGALPPEPAADDRAETSPAALEAMRRDDEAAEEALAALAPGVRIARRVAGIVLWVSTGATIVFAVVALILDANGVDLDDVAPVGFGLLALAFLGAGLTWTISAELDVRMRRRAATDWLAAADAEQRDRGLPAPFAAAWMQVAPGHRALVAGGFVAGMIGMFGLIGGIVLFTDAERSGAAWIALAIGIAASAAAILAVVRIVRRRRADARWIVTALGPRVG